MNRSPHFVKVSEHAESTVCINIDVGLDASGRSPGSGQDYADRSHAKGARA